MVSDFRGVRQGNVLSSMLLSMVMNDIVRVTGQDIRIAETMVCADDIFI
jgi:hypothetical protein